MLVKIVPLAAKNSDGTRALASEVVLGDRPTAKLSGTAKERRHAKRGLKRWSRRLHPTSLAKEVKIARPVFKTKNGRNIQYGDLRDAQVRVQARRWLGGSEWSKIIVLAIDPGEANTIAAFGSTPTTAPGFEGRAESTLYYRSGTLLAARNESVREGHRFRNRLGEELCEEVANAVLSDPVLASTIETLHALNKENEWRQLRNVVDRTAEISRAASDILRSVFGGREEQRTREQLGDMKLLVFVGDGGAGVRKGSRGPNPANRIIRELELQAEARGVAAKFLVTPETMTSQRCSRPWCRDSEGRRSK